MSTMPHNEQTSPLLDDDPLWFKDAIIYELHVRAFHDSNADGVGDFRGLTDKLDYLQDLGVTAIWLLPFCPSPLRDDGYDIADFTNIHPSYGIRRDFRAFVREAHRRGLRVITELVVNHTSDQHPWFQRARVAPSGSKWRNFYVWSERGEEYQDTRIIFKDTEQSNWTWDPVAKAYFWHRFFSHQPDLNYDNPDVQRAIFEVLDFWLDMGVDGLRLDAVPYLYEREGTNCENLDETHAYLKKLRNHVDKKYQDRMFLAEANQWPEDAAAYFGDGDECHMNFHFPLMPRLFMAMQMEDRYPIIDILDQTPDIPENCQWALFLRNHDELTLEMVTDEERDYMYRMFAHDSKARINLGIRRRLSPLLGNDRKKIELMYSLLFSMPGTPVIYYGEEIGMGDNYYLGDRNGVRTPMQWNADRNAGFSRANPHKLYLPIIIDPEYHYEAVNVELQQNNAQSLLWWMKRMLSIRKQFKVFGRGSIHFLHPANRKVIVYLRQYGEELVLIAANLSRYAQCVELDLSKYKGRVPISVFGKTKFPPIGDLPYFLTLSGHTFYWFQLQPSASDETQIRSGDSGVMPQLTITRDWEYLLTGRDRKRLEAILPDYLQRCRWFGGKARILQNVEIADTIAVPNDDPLFILSFLKVEYTEGEPETYLLPLRFITLEEAEQLAETPALISSLKITRKGHVQDGMLCDAMWTTPFLQQLLDGMTRHRRYNGPNGDFVATARREFRRELQTRRSHLSPSLYRGEQSNSSVLFGNEFILKLFRRAESGINPDWEIGQFLTEHGFQHMAPVAGLLEYQKDNGESITIGILQRYVENEGDAWRYTLDELSRYYENASTHPTMLTADMIPDMSLPALLNEEVPSSAQEFIGPYLEEARRLGMRTGELHVALASDKDDPNFSPEPFTDFYRRGLYQSMVGLTNQNLPLLRQRLNTLPDSVQGSAKSFLDMESRLRKCFLPVRDKKIHAMRIRCHGDYHLGQVLYTGKDFLIIDFEGEPARPLSIRRLKESPLRDVAGMLRSFHYASYSCLVGQIAGVRPEDFPVLEPWARFWQLWVSAIFLNAYLSVTRDAQILPQPQDDLFVLLDAYILQKAIYELGYELNNRPDWVGIPLDGIRQILKAR
ncbi:MAG: maltose alpha-D-glucosyltransferase [Nitrospirales bacterium]|nr:maltose alpha-D-glucosyltransferase [Nitrospira sp.]MDR4502203.1 maltose alpha-D-glucosyltransferase [Nitrospirales bacterium]